MLQSARSRLIFRDSVEEGEDQDHIADGLRQHEHAEHRDDPGKHGNGNIERERKQDPEPDQAEALCLHAVLVILDDDQNAEDHEGNVAQDPPEHAALIRDPSILREQADENANSGERIDSYTHVLLFFEPVVQVPDVVHEHVKDGHGDGGDELADTQRGGKVRVNEIVQGPGNKMERVTASEDQHRCSHQFFRLVP